MSKRAIRPKRGRIVALGSAAALAAAGVAGGIWASADAAAPTPVAGTYTLVNAVGGLCLDVPGSSSADGVQLAQHACGGAGQTWRLTAAGSGFTLVAAHSGKCAAVRDGKTGAGAAVQQEACTTGAPAQTWTFTAVDGGYRLVNGGSGKCLAVKDGSAAPGTPVQQNSCDSAPAKRWALKAAAATAAPTASGTATATASATPSTSAKPTATATATAKPTATASATATATGSISAWPTPTVDVPLTATQKVTGVFDGGGKRYVGKGALGSGDQSESQPALFELADGAVLQNVVLGDPAADGVHCGGTCTLKNVWWENVGEDAATFKGTSASQVMTIDGGGARGADDKVFQHNGPGTMVIKNFRVDDFGKLYRSCGNCKTQYARHVVIDNVMATVPGKKIVGINSNLGDTAKITRLTIVGDTSKKITVCQRFTGVTSGEPKESGSGPDGTSCLYTAADVTYRP
ncbi:pectate lyase [Kitasatospora sp. NBC_01539]|uniref:pectate lyase n=1 Tax=Kitasatospora sp. NBC_01539 TaxID=2903577 RepID=UPI00386015A7